MTDIFNPKKEKASFVISNIKTIKIIAIILGILIIVGLFFLFWGIAKSYNKLDKLSYNKILEDNNKIMSEFIFNEPADAQLISSSLGQNNQILLRYLYKGKNTLVILNVKTKQIISVITLKKGSDVFESN
tara:strand:- start:35 stop:424 length:390 start_codon:yes stop_codon:yes gene_type:complete